jgi:N-methylhydantoinase B
VRNDGCFFTCAYTRNKHLPWAVDGGLEGSPNVAEVIRADGTREEYAVVTGLTVNDGDVIRVRTGNGGGYGDPRRRDPAAVAADVRNGFITPERAQEVYGAAG